MRVGAARVAWQGEKPRDPGDLGPHRLRLSWRERPHAQRAHSAEAAPRWWGRLPLFPR